MTKYISILFIGCILLLTSACTGAVKQPTIAQGSSYPEPGYPAPSLLYPYPESAETTPLATSGPPPKPSADSGIVTGRLLSDGEPAVNLILYLAETFKDGTGVERVATYSRIDSPRALTDADGKFYFVNVPPGKYGLVYDMVGTAILLHKPGSPDEQLLLVVEAGKPTDLGDMDYEALPLP